MGGARSRGLAGSVVGGCVLGLVGLVAGGAHGQPRVVVDGAFSDWSSSDVSVADPVGDAVDLQDLVSMDVKTAGTVVYIHLAFTEALNIQSADAIGTGVDVVFDLPGDAVLRLELGNRNPVYVAGGQERRLVWTEIDYASLPTPASTEYELRVDLGRLPTPVLSGAAVSVRVERSDTSKWAAFVLDEPAEDFELRPIGRFPCTDFRVASLNTLFNGLTQPQEVERRERLRRLVAAADADVYAFQEQNNSPVNPAIDLGALLTQLDPLDDGSVWTAHGSGDVVVSRFPMTPLPPTQDGNSAVVELPGGPVLVYSFHPRCCGVAGDSRDRQRVAASEALVAQVAAFRAGQLGDELAAFADAPVIVIGDYNLVGSFEPLDVLRDAGLSDWPLLDLAGREATTWRSVSGQAGGFWPGRLDLVTHSAGLGRRNGYVVETGRLSEDRLRQFRPALQPGDSLGSDHLLMVADFGPELVADQDGDGRLGPGDVDAWLPRYREGDLRADVNRDGELTGADFNAWLRAFAAGCE